LKSIPGLLFNIYKFGLRKKIFEKLSQWRYTEYERIQGQGGRGEVTDTTVSADPESWFLLFYLDL
jgi:hypothetical protein